MRPFRSIRSMHNSTDALVCIYHKTMRCRYTEKENWLWNFGCDPNFGGGQIVQLCLFCVADKLLLTSAFLFSSLFSRFFFACDVSSAKHLWVNVVVYIHKYDSFKFSSFAFKNYKTICQLRIVRSLAVYSTQCMRIHIIHSTTHIHNKTLTE